jgi:uncharacterized membrane protein YdjX (TVP38/TMEM64 family)
MTPAGTAAQPSPEEMIVTVSSPRSPDAPRARAVPWAKLAFAALALAGLVAAGRLAGGRIDELRAWIDGLGAIAPLAFVGAYALGVVAFLPGAALTLAGGALFGVAKGTAIVFVAALLGSTLAFLIARYVARGFVEQRIAGNPQFAAIDGAIGQQGRRIVFLLRLSPVFPFSLGNYALGLTRVRLADYVMGAAGMLPGTFLYVYIGSLAGDVAAAAGGGGAGTGKTILAAIGVAATIVVTVLVTRIARRALAEASGRDLAAKE